MSNSNRKKLVDLICKLFYENGFFINDIESIDFIDDLGMESMVFMSMIVEIENAFNVIIPDDFLIVENFKNIITVIETLEKIIND